MKKQKTRTYYSEAEKTITWFYLQNKNLSLSLSHCKRLLSELIGGDLGRDILKCRVRLCDIATAGNRRKVLLPSEDTRKTLLQALKADQSFYISDIETIPVLDLPSKF